MANVGIVIVSHSAKVAEGAADMAAIVAAWSDARVAILVDLGGAETNSEMAVELFGEERRDRVVICNAPIVEGAVIAAAESSGGSPLAIVKQVAEELSPQYWPCR